MFNPILWIDKVCSAPNRDLGVYVLGPTNYSPGSFQWDQGFLYWGKNSRIVQVRKPEKQNLFGPFYDPQLVARACQLPYQDLLVLEIESALGEQLSTYDARGEVLNEIHFLSARETFFAFFRVSLEWFGLAQIANLPKWVFQKDPRYQKAKKKILKEGKNPELLRDAGAIPVSVYLRGKEKADFAILTVSPPTAELVVFFPKKGGDGVIAPGLIVEHRGQAVAKIIQVCYRENLD